MHSDDGRFHLSLELHYSLHRHTIAFGKFPPILADYPISIEFGFMYMEPRDIH